MNNKSNQIVIESESINYVESEGLRLLKEGYKVTKPITIKDNTWQALFLRKPFRGFFRLVMFKPITQLKTT